MSVVTSEPTPVKLRAITSGTSVRNRKTLVPAKTVYTATKVEKVVSTSGKVQYTTTVIQYDNANKDNPKTIATGFTYQDPKTGASKSVLQPVDGLDEQTRRALTTAHGTRNKNLRGGGTTQVDASMYGDIAKVSQQQIRQSKDIQALADKASDQETLDAAGGQNKETETNTMRIQIILRREY